MDFKSIANRAKQAVDKRGGTESLKEDASELKDIAKGSGSLKDKAKAAVEAIKDPGEEPAAQAGSDEAPVGPAGAEGERHRGGRHGEGQGGRHQSGGGGRHQGGGGRARP
jgi:hypothetical protein